MLGTSQTRSNNLRKWLFEEAKPDMHIQYGHFKKFLKMLAKSWDNEKCKPDKKSIR
jgi:hypothetical protein